MLLGPRTNRQAGVATIPLLVMALGLVLIAILLGTALSTAKGLSNSFKSQQHDYMVEVQDKLASWYRRNLTVEADGSYVITSEQLFTAISTERRYGVALVLSQQLNDGSVYYHKIAIVAPGSTSQSSPTSTYGSFDEAGKFTAPIGFAVLEFDGKGPQYAALKDTNGKLERIAAMLEQYVAVRLNEDANSDSTNNYFRPLRDCSHVGTRELPCTNGFVSVAQMLQAEALKGAGNGAPTINAWGSDIVVTNDISDPSEGGPFTMTVATNTPWNQTLLVKAVQPIF